MICQWSTSPRPTAIRQSSKYIWLKVNSFSNSPNLIIQTSYNIRVLSHLSPYKSSTYASPYIYCCTVMHTCQILEKAPDQESLSWGIISSFRLIAKSCVVHRKKSQRPKYVVTVSGSLECNLSQPASLNRWRLILSWPDIAHRHSFHPRQIYSTCFSHPMRPSNSFRSLCPGRLTPELIPLCLFARFLRSQLVKLIPSTPTSSSTASASS